MIKDRSIYRQGPWIVALIVFQSLCAGFFTADALADLTDTSQAHTAWYQSIETAASLGLIIAVIFEVAYLVGLWRRQAAMARGLQLASGALYQVMQGYFRSWHLTAAERDVAIFVFKGCSIAEIAGLRGSAEGTIKAHLNRIYRKAEVSNRSELQSLLIEDLMHQPLTGGAALAPAGAQEHADVGKSTG